MIDIPVKLAEAYVEIGADSTKFKRELDKVQRELQRKSQQMQSNMRVAGAAMAGIGAAVTAGFAKAVVTFGQFEQVMANVGAVSNATGQEMEKLTEFAKKMGETTIFTARESGKAMYFLASAGFSAEQQMASTNAVMKLAGALQGDLSQASQLTVSSLKAFGLAADEADRVVNVFAASVSSSQTTMERLSVGMPILATTFNKAGISIESTAAALSIIVDQGLEASRGATGLRTAIQNLIKPTKEGTRALEEMGLTLADVNPETNKLVDVVRTLEDAGLTSAQSIAIFGKRAEGMAILVAQGADALEEMEAKITDTNRAAEMASRQLDTLAGKFKLLVSAAEGLQITLAEQLAPALENMTESITETVSELNKWIKVHPIISGLLIRFTAVVGGLVGAGGVLLLLAPAIVASKVAFVGLVAAIPPVLAVLTAVGSSFWAVHKIIKSLTDDVDNVKVKMAEFEKSGQKFSGVFKDIHEALDDFGGDKASATFADLGIDVGKLNKEINKGTITWRFWNKAVKVNIRENATVSSVLTALNTNIYQGSRALKDYTDGLGDAADSVGALAGNLKNLGRYLLEVAEGAGDMIKKLKGIQDIKLPQFGEIVPPSQILEFGKKLRARTLPGTRDIRTGDTRPSVYDPSRIPTTPPPEAVRKAWEIYWKEKREGYEKDLAAQADYNQRFKNLAESAGELTEFPGDLFAVPPETVRKAWEIYWKEKRERYEKDLAAQDDYNNRVKKSLEEMGTFITNFTDAFQPAFQNLFTNLFDSSQKDKWKQFWGDMKDILISQLAEIATGGIFDLLKTGGKKLLGIEDDDEDKALSFTDTMRGLAGSTDDVVQGMQSATLATKAFAAAIEEAGLAELALAPTLQLFPGENLLVQSAAQGGIFKKPQLVMIGDTPGGGGEAVIPLKDGKVPVEINGTGGGIDGGTGGGMGGNTYNYHLHLSHPDVKQITREEMEYLFETKVADAEMSARAKGWVA